LLVDGVRELQTALLARLGAIRIPQLTYAGHFVGIYRAREAAETDVVVLLRVWQG
jgi:hypothetical protein